MGIFPIVFVVLGDTNPCRLDTAVDTRSTEYICKRETKKKKKKIILQFPLYFNDEKLR